MRYGSNNIVDKIAIVKDKLHALPASNVTDRLTLEFHIQELYDERIRQLEAQVLWLARACEDLDAGNGTHEPRIVEQWLDLSQSEVE